nr:MAG TPA: hypothetical protein [Bacteriophage sp.]
MKQIFPMRYQTFPKLHICLGSTGNSMSTSEQFLRSSHLLLLVN